MMGNAAEQAPGFSRLKGPELRGPAFFGGPSQPMAWLIPTGRMKKKLYGDWECVVQDLASGEKVYINRRTGEVTDDPPDEVLQGMKEKKRASRAIAIANA